MRAIWLAFAAGAVGTAIVVAGAGASTAANRIQLRAAMNAAEEVPAPRGEVANARGVFTASATKTASGATLNWNLTFSGLTGPATAAHIHTAARGAPGPVSAPLCGPCESGATGSVDVDATLLAAIQSGGTYVNVHTATNGPGEIRAQLGTVANVTARLNAAQERPRPAGAARARGSFTLTATKADTGTRLAWRLTFSRLTGTATAAHIHIGRRGVAGPVAIPLCGPCRSGARGTVTPNRAALAALEAGRAYVNVHTARNPAGEIRGQVPAVPLTITP
jgi:hypothetical protein